MGLLGGSFNPAHDGHRHISLIALKALALDEIWWLVSPQNPLKPVAGMAPLAARLAEARRVAAHPRIRVTDLESRLGTRYTADSLAALKKRYRRCAFVWLMGADNLIEIVRWHRWETIFALVPIAVLDRPSYSYRAIAGRAACRFERARLAERRARGLALSRPPAWVFLRARTHPASATAIRRARGADRRCARAGRAAGPKGGSAATRPKGTGPQRLT